MYNYAIIYPLPVATLTTEISGGSENLDRPCPGDTVVYTCTLSGTALEWNIPGLFEGQLRYNTGLSSAFVGATQSDPNSRCQSNLTAIGADSLTSTLTITALNETVRNGSTIVCSGIQHQVFMMDMIITSECYNYSIQHVYVVWAYAMYAR